MNVVIPVITKDEFRQLLLENIVNDKENYTKEQVIELMIDTGFPKLDFEVLDKCLSQMFVYLPTVAVDFGDSRFVWLVSGSHAILIEKNENDTRQGKT